MLVWTILSGRPGATLVIFSAAALSDALDGVVARRLGLQSEFGAKLDPIADKVFLSAAFLSLGATGAVPAWLVIVVFCRDLALLAGAAAAMRFLRIERFPPSIWGKGSTLLQVLYVLVVLLGGATLGAALAPVVALVTIASGIHYFWRGWTESTPRR
jgi:cardiolipin synthase